MYAALWLFCKLTKGNKVGNIANNKECCAYSPFFESPASTAAQHSICQHELGDVPQCRCTNPANAQLLAFLSWPTHETGGFWSSGMSSIALLL
jgi:hypothetical protein